MSIRIAIAASSVFAALSALTSLGALRLPPPRNATTSSSSSPAVPTSLPGSAWSVRHSSTPCARW